MRRAFILALVVAALVSGCGGGGGRGGQLSLDSHYTFAELAPAQGGRSVCAYLINNKGMIAGGADTGVASSDAFPPQWPCVWQPGITSPVAFSDLCLPSDMNESGQAVLADATVVDLSDGTSRQLGMVPGAMERPSARAINDHGVCVGSIMKDDGEKAVIWDERGVACELETPAGYDSCSADDINNRDQVVGSAGRNSDVEGHAVLWSADGHVQKVFSEPKGFHSSRATQINDLGDILVIYDASFDHDHSSCAGAAVYRPDGSYRLLARPENRQSYPFTINNRGQVLGVLDDRIPAIWNPDGSVVRLPSPHEGLEFHVSDINNNGVAVGDYGPDEEHCYHAVVWTPR